MNNQHPFTIYNASAGSGKTFTLVKEYLKILLQSNNTQQYKYILAITFTNKAVGEMKERIIEMLTEFSSEDILNKPNSMFTVLTEELQMKPELLQKKSKKILNSIIYNYAAFDVSTIDGFTHKIIRTFAHDLKLPLNFEVELDQDSLLQEAVDSLIAKAGTNKQLTKVLVDFAIEKADEDKSWDISFDFNKIAKLLVNESDVAHIEKLKDKSLDDFKALKTQIKKDLKSLEEEIVEISKNVLQLISEAGLQFNDFSSSYLPKHFEKLANKNFAVSLDTKWQITLINNETLYPKRLTPELGAVIDGLQPQFIKAFEATKNLVFQQKFLKAFYKNITPLSVLSAINQELTNLKLDQNKLLISEFNTLISKEIKDQPTPFIYERLGEKFRYYFIDEFQDTSKLQWQNLIPLIDNSLAGENLKQEKGTAMLVGDSKQAIYRWRGGEADQFIDLYSKKSLPFQVEQHVDNLPTNYRSYKEIILFNNSFFKYVAETFFSNPDYNNLYIEGSKQNTFNTNEGYIQLEFLDLKNENRDEIYPQKTLEIIKTCLKNGFTYQDICILVRKKKEGVAIAEFLNTENIPIMSSETMLIFNSPEVQFIHNILTLLVQSDNDEIKVKALNYLTQKFKIKDKHAFFSKHIKQSLFQTFKSFETYNIYLTPNQLLQLPLYELAESIVRNFKLIETSNAYVQYYLDFVLEYAQKQGSSLSGFLEHANNKKENLSIVSPQGQNAVQIMTIHKSKGLEFPVVILPYADLNIYKEIEPKEWFPLQAENFNGFSSTLLNYNKEFENYGEVGLQIHNKHQAELELDNINLLYVALTRPKEQLFILSQRDVSKNELEQPKSFAGLFINYLVQQQKYHENESLYTFGNAKKTSTPKVTPKKIIEQQEFITTTKESHNIKIVTNSGYLWNTTQEKAIEKGNLIHNIMAHIKTKEDITFAISHFLDKAIINPDQAQELQKTVTQIIEHKALKNFFTEENTIYNERDIISNQEIIRPDRLVINAKNEATIIDYKTGAINNKHQLQLENYQRIIEEMPYQVTNKILVYINEDIHVVTF
ncbi:UvrD-helicase domain-containing protein [Lacinutrix sp. C3R15]|uniref:UvrD-helicase domain-containing protein n=1 Tax=Flavobacteriaceae TaxID=49546 RepID=UPI001C099EF3|nr:MULTISPECIES: UvrD-helicase domain-containing protein [Flavobacteriaceae]MBU2937942.1 UvrD-helicase domain-containing protein [Lacinutrix sp. C3R15]MDO6621256.1 UvrD-helicase domain-containing protein [Oceanihabitans sp. 1_MG-2023]